MPRPSLTFLLAALLLPLASSQLSAGLALRENFALTRPDHAGRPIHGSLAADGKSSWIATPNLSYAADTTASPGVNVTTIRGYVAKVPLPRDTRAVRLTATLSPVSVDKQNNWAGIGIGNPGKDKLEITWPGGVLLLVHTDGRFAVSVENPEPDAERKRLSLISEMVPGRKPGQPVVATLQYDSAKGTVSAWINGRHVLDNYDLKSRGVVPDLSFAGFSGYHQPTDQSPVADFSLETRP